MAGMTNKDAWLYAESWGSFMTSGDPGACLYGFSEDFRVQSESHRADCLEQMAQNRAYVEAHPDQYESDEIEQIDALCERLKSARLEGEPETLETVDELTGGFIEALFFTDNAVNAENGRDFEATAESEDDENEGNFPASAAPDDLAPATLEKIKADCAAFQAQAADLLTEAAGRGYSLARAGHDFWLTRNGHGVGFWDRSELEDDSPEYERLTAEMVANRDNADAWGAALAKRNALESQSLGKRLTAVADGFGEVDSYFGDDGRVHV
jgi:hypothetical protein